MMQQSHDSLNDFTFPNRQINQNRDEAHRDKSESNHQPVRSVHQHHLLPRTVREVVRVDKEEEVLNVWVRVITADHTRQLLQAHCHVVVRSVIDREIHKITTNTPTVGNC